MKRLMKKCVVFVLSGSNDLNPELRRMAPLLLEVKAGDLEFDIRPFGWRESDEDDDEASGSPKLGSQIVVTAFEEFGVVAVAFQHEPPPAGRMTSLDHKLSVMGASLGTMGGGGNGMRSAHEGFAIWYKPAAV